MVNFWNSLVVKVAKPNHIINEEIEVKLVMPTNHISPINPDYIHKILKSAIEFKVVKELRSKH